jgi:hypothetical protein
MGHLTRRRRLWVTIGVVTGSVIVAALPLAVPTTVIAPEGPSEPVPVFLVDYGRTPALVLPLDENRMVAYVYGDWNYYALRNQGAADSIAALLWPTQGALGRKEIAGQPAAEAVRRGIGSEVEEIYTLRVDRLGVERLRGALDAFYQERLETAVSAYGMMFVHHPQPYTYWSNSNHMTAAWMKALGCEIRGPAFGSWWRVRTAE